MSFFTLSSDDFARARRETTEYQKFIDEQNKRNAQRDNLGRRPGTAGVTAPTGRPPATLDRGLPPAQTAAAAEAKRLEDELFAASQAQARRAQEAEFVPSVGLAQPRSTTPAPDQNLPPQAGLKQTPGITQIQPGSSELVQSVQGLLARGDVSAALMQIGDRLAGGGPGAGPGASP